MLCVLTLLLSLALPLLNNKPSVCECVCGAIFGPFKATKRSPLSCSFSLFLFSIFLQLYGTEQEPIGNVNCGDLQE